MAERAIYSAPLLQYSAASPITEFEVPAGFVAVVRQISYCVTVSSSEFSVNFQDSIDAPAFAIDIRTISGTLTTEHYEGRWVCPEGGIISLYVSSIGSQPFVYVGGYLLRA